MTVKELKDRLSKVVNQNLEVVILSDQLYFKPAEEVFEDKIGYDNTEVKPCIRIK